MALLADVLWGGIAALALVVVVADVVDVIRKRRR